MSLSQANAKDIRVIIISKKGEVMNWINSWGASAKQWDKIGFEVRLFGLTAFEYRMDLSFKHIRLIVLNFGFDFKR